VYGYVLIAMVSSSEIPLTSLRIIRGLLLFKPPVQNIDSNYDRLAQKGFSLYVASNTIDFNIGLDELQLPSLQGKCLS